MTTVNYPTPILINGYRCKNCTDVDYAKKHIDPQHPKDGPYGINKPENSDRAGTTDATRGPAVLFGGRIAPPVTSTDSSAPAASSTQGVNVDLKV
jgi:hypothetical protein